MFFFSDNIAAAHPAVLAALSDANAAGTNEPGYGGDRWTRALERGFAKLFELPDDRPLALLCVATGTASNALALAALCPPYRAVVAHSDAHIQCDEAGAPEFFTGGAKILTVDGPGAKLSPDRVNARLDALANDVHRMQPAALSITNATEYGTVYRVDEMMALGALARQRGLRVHLDGARLANACVSTGTSPADLTWRAGVDALSFGFIKNGGMDAEALILFDPALVEAAQIRRKRAGLLASKGRFMAAQLLALLEEDRWLDNARAANAAARRIGMAAGNRLLHPVEANAVFVALDEGEAAKLRAQGFGFYDWADGEVRFVTAWDTRTEHVDALCAALKSL